MSSVKNRLSTNNNNESTQIGLATSNSEDIQIIDSKIVKYLVIKDKIREVIDTDTTDKDAWVSDIIDAFSRLSNSPTLLNLILSLITLGIVPIKNYIKRKKLRKVIENILKKIFDVTLGYAMDYKDLQQTCANIGGKDYFSKEDHRNIYIAVIQKLKQGPIRDRCFKLSIVNFVNEKLTDIGNNFLWFRINILE